MKKRTLRFLSVVMSAVTAFSMAVIPAPATVNAAEGDVAINATNFPDENFRSSLSKYIDRDSNGSLSASEIASVTSLTSEYMYGSSYYSNSYYYNIDDSGVYGGLTLYDVQDVTGIEYFTDLTYVYLDSITNTSIDFTKMTDVSSIDIRFAGQLKSIDITGLKNLYYLSVTNCGVFESLDVSTNDNLYSVSCAGNDLFTTFKTGSNNKQLSSVYVYGPSVKSLDLSNLSALTAVALCDCDISLDSIGIKNKNKITTIAIRNNKKSGFVPSEYKNLACLEYDSCGLKSIDLSKNKKLYSVSLKDNALKSVDVSKLKKLWYLDVSYNKLSKINTSKNKELGYLNVASNGIKKLDFSKNKQLYEVQAYSNASLNKLDISKFKYLTFGVDKNTKVVLPKDTYNLSYYSYKEGDYVEKTLKKSTFTPEEVGLGGCFYVYFYGKNGNFTGDFW